MREKLTWLAFVAGIFAILWLSGDGFYRYPCQSPQLFDAVECNPPLCLRTRNCASDLTGVSE
jgi:hypothetical protein